MVNALQIGNWRGNEASLLLSNPSTNQQARQYNLSNIAVADGAQRRRQRRSVIYHRDADDRDIVMMTMMMMMLLLMTLAAAAADASQSSTMSGTAAVATQEEGCLYSQDTTVSGSGYCSINNKRRKGITILHSTAI